MKDIMDEFMVLKGFEKNMNVLKTSALMSDSRFHLMYTTLGKYLKEQSQQLQSDKSKSNNKQFDFRPFLYGPEDNYEKPFVLTLVKLLVDLNSENDVTKQQELLKNIFKWYKSNKKLLNLSINVDEEIMKKQCNGKSPIPVISYSKRDNQKGYADKNEVSNEKHTSSTNSIEYDGKNSCSPVMLPYIDINPSMRRNKYPTAPILSVNTIRGKDNIQDEQRIENKDWKTKVEDIYYYTNKYAYEGKFKEYTKSNYHLRNRSHSSDYVLLKKNSLILSLEDENNNYNVHKTNNQVKIKSYPIKLSGSVQPDSCRYKWSEDSFGGKTYRKRIHRPVKIPGKKILNGNEAANRINTHMLASAIVVKHLSEKKSSHGLLQGKSNDEISKLLMEQINDKPVVFDEEYVQLAKKLMQHNVNSNQDLPLHVKTKSFPNEEMKAFLEDSANHHTNHPSEAFPMNTKGKGLKLSQRPVPGTPKISDAITLNYDDIESRLPFDALVENLPLTNKKDESSRLSISPSSPRSTRHSRNLSLPNQKHDSSRLSISPSSSRATSRSSNYVEDSRRTSCISVRVASAEFETADFNHFCDGHEFHDLDAATKYQMQINAAIDIQRLFRGHVVRRYMKQLKESNLQRQKKTQNAITYAQRKYEQELVRLKEAVDERPCVSKDEKWTKEYKNQLKEQENIRNKKMTKHKIKQARLEIKHINTVKVKTASSQIHEIFHNNGPTKAQKKAAALKIQKVVRGWLVRLHMKAAKTKIMKRALSFHSFIKETYLSHLKRLMKRYGVTEPKIMLDYKELLHYVEKRNKYEIEFDRLCDDNEKTILYVAIKDFFEACGLFPSNHEIKTAVSAVMIEKGITEIDEHNFTKQQVIEIAFQIYVPLGSHIENNRKSTWLSPLIDGKEARMFNKKGMVTSYEKCFEVLVDLKNEK